MTNCNCFTYCGATQGDKDLGTISFENSTIVAAKDCARPHGFEIRLPERTYYFAAANESDMLDWIKILDDVKFQVRRCGPVGCKLSLQGRLPVAGCHLPLCP